MRILPLLLLSVITLSACFSGKPFQPPRSNFEVWQKPGASTLQVKKALLECGAPHPQEDHRTANQRAETQNCLIADGYSMAKKSLDMCSLQAHLPACLSGVKPPLPSAHLRLNSDYCRATRDVEFCRRTVTNPSACTNQPIVPECLP